MRTSDFMRTDIFTIPMDAALEAAMRLMTDQAVSMLPVVNAQHQLEGVLLMEDVINQFLPNFTGLLENTDFIHDYGGLEHGRKLPHLLTKPIRALMNPKYSVRETDGIMACVVMMNKHNSPHLPVVNQQNEVVGVVSFAVVGSHFLNDLLTAFDKQA